MATSIEACDSNKALKPAPFVNTVQSTNSVPSEYLSLRTLLTTKERPTFPAKIYISYLDGRQGDAPVDWRLPQAGSS